MSSERVSVIIPARDAPLLPQVIASLAAPGNRASIAEVVIVGDGSDALDGSSFPRFVRIPTPHPVTSPVARNVGIRAARSDWLAFLDADCITEPGWLPALLAAGMAGHPVVGGGVAFGRSSYWADVHNLSMMHDYHVSTPTGERLFLPTLNLLVHRDVIARVGLMNEALRRAQDLEWTARMSRQGIPLWFEPRAIVTHHPVRRLDSLWRDYFEGGRTSFLVRAQRADRMALPPWMHSARLLRALSPAIATAATLRIFVTNRALTSHLLTAPGIWLTKLAWCLGAASGADEPGVP